MSELRLALPECKYRNDTGELLKDQFIFGMENKEIQGHLLGEIEETDNSVRALYEARKIKSKLAQRQMLGIVNPSTLVSKEAKGGHQDNDQKCDYYGHSHSWGKQNCPAYGKTCDKCGQKKTLQNCV